MVSFPQISPTEPCMHLSSPPYVDCVWNVMARTQKPDFVFRRNGRVHLKLRGLQFSRLLAAEVCTSAVVILDKPRSEVVWSVLTIHSLRQFPLHFPSRASPCAITFQLDPNSCVKEWTTCSVFINKHIMEQVQQNSTYPDAGYPDRHLSESAWPFG